MSSPEPDTLRYLAWLYSPPPERPALAALCQIEREIAASLAAGLEHQVAHVRLEWWRQECARCAVGSPVHPLTQALSAHWQACGQGGNPLEALAGLTENAAWDLASATLASREELTAYCRRWAAAMVEPVAVAAAGPDRDALWARLGAALREIELLCDLARDARYGRLRVPLAELERRGARPEALATPPWPASLCALLRERHQELRGEIAATVARIPPHSQPRVRGLLVWVALAWYASWGAERALPRPPARTALTGVAANWRAWRAARAAAAGVFRLGPKSPDGGR